MKKEFYRFRRIESLLGDFKELESQSIYFADPNSLNDPMEGFRDIYWSGDFIVWKNLFRHYLLCLERLCSLLTISGEEHPISADDMPVFSGENDFPTDIYKNNFSVLAEHFFKNKALVELIKQISDRSTPVRRDELFFYLKSVHSFALETIYTHYENIGLIPPRTMRIENADKTIVNLVKNNYFLKLEKALQDDGRVGGALFVAQKNANSQIELIHAYNGGIDKNQKNKNLVFIDFVDEYLLKIERLIFPEWYTACFMSECKSSSVWGHYGGNHTGVCLIFESEEKEENHFLNLNSKNGYGANGATYSFMPHKFYPIDYESGFGEIDFFRMLGRLPIPKLNAMWYTLDGKFSVCAEAMISSEQTWRDDYWKKFYRDIIIKSKDWAYENEYRLILSSTFDSFSDPKDRVLTYDFKCLKGIVFGIKTKKEDKLEIMNIIDKKCQEHKRYDFKFYQAYYSESDKCISYTELSFLKIAHTST